VSKEDTRRGVRGLRARPTVRPPACGSSPRMFSDG